MKREVSTHDLPVVTVVESTVGYSKEGSGLRVVSVLTVALQESQSGDEVAFLQEMVGIWQSE